MNNILSKFAILLLAVMPLAANVAGQNSVYGIPPLTSTNSLIRNYGDKADIIYNDNGVRSFSHVNFATLIVSNAVVPNLQSVSDMEIVVDALYSNNGAVVYGISSGGYISTWVTNNPVCSCDKMMNVAVQGTIHSASPWNVSISNDTFSPTSAYVSPNKTYYILYDVCR